MFVDPSKSATVSKPYTKRHFNSLIDMRGIKHSDWLLIPRVLSGRIQNERRIGDVLSIQTVTRALFVDEKQSLLPNITPNESVIIKQDYREYKTTIIYILVFIFITFLRSSR